MYGCTHGYYRYSRDRTGKKMRHCDLCDKLVLDSEIKRLREEKEVRLDRYCAINRKETTVDMIEP